MLESYFWLSMEQLTLGQAAYFRSRFDLVSTEFAYVLADLGQLPACIIKYEISVVDPAAPVPHLR